MYKTSLGLSKMKSWSHNKPKLFLFLAYLSIFVGVVGLVLSFLFMFYQLYLVVDLDLTQGGGLVLPIQTESGTVGGIPVVAPPFLEWLVALVVLVVVHEFAHGVISQRFDIRIKSSGFAFGSLIAPILPAAFVEPDEKQLKKAKWWKQIAVFGAGSTSNFIFGSLFLGCWIVMGLWLNSFVEFGSIDFVSIDNESGLYDYNITSGRILELNGMSDSEEMYIYMQNLSLDEELNLTIESDNVTQSVFINAIPGVKDSEKGRIGIYLDTENLIVPVEGKEVAVSVIDRVNSFLFWLWLLNIGIGIMNLLPLWITDGGQILRTLLLEKFKEKRAYSILNWFSFVSLITIVLMMWPSLLKSLVGLFV